MFASLFPLFFHCFNPRPRVGGDAKADNPLTSQVSIHAPAWGATKKPARKELAIKGFNPRPRVGGDYHKLNKLDF